MFRVTPIGSISYMVSIFTKKKDIRGGKGAYPKREGGAGEVRVLRIIGECLAEHRSREKEKHSTQRRKRRKGKHSLGQEGATAKKRQGYGKGANLGTYAATD